MAKRFLLLATAGLIVGSAVTASLKEQIEKSLNDFTEATLQDDGRFGAGLKAFSVQLTSSIRRQETAWGRWAARMQGFLNL